MHNCTKTSKIGEGVSVLFVKIALVAVAVCAMSVPSRAGTYYKLGNDESGFTSFSGAYSGGGGKIGWTDSRDGKSAVTPTDIGNSDFIVGKMLRPDNKATSQTFPGKTLTLETGGQINVAINGTLHTLTVATLVGAGGRILFNSSSTPIAPTTIFEGGMQIESGSSLEFRLYAVGPILAKIASKISGDATAAINLKVYNQYGKDPSVKTLQLQDAANFYGKIADSSDYNQTGDNLQTGRLHLKLTGGFGGSIESLPRNTQRVTVNYDGLPSGKGLVFSSATIHDAVKTGVVFYAATSALLKDGLVLMTFPAGTALDASAFTVKYAGADTEDGTAYAHLKKIDNADGTVSLAVSNEGDFPEDGDVIDLAGTSRPFPCDWIRLCRNAFTVTDTVGGGEARFNVPAGVEVVNTNATLTGKLKFVKEGEGTFVSKLPQTYTGGNLISGGIAKPPSSGGGESTAYMPDRNDGNGIQWTTFGDYSAGTEAATIRVGEGAVFDISGIYGFRVYRFVLAGGTLRNSVSQGKYNTRYLGLYIDSLEGASTLDIDGNTRYWDGSNDDANRCNLAGAALDVKIASGKHLGVSTSFTNGTLRLSGGGTFCVLQAKGSESQGNTPATLRMDGVTLEQTSDGALSVGDGVTMYVENYTCAYTGSSKSGSGTLRVSGVFTPVTQKFWPAILAAGATIAISEREGTFMFASGVSGAPAISFDNGADITLATGERILVDGEKLVGWSTAPASTVTFSPEAGVAAMWSFRRKSDGVYAHRKKGFMVIVK